MKLNHQAQYFINGIILIVVALFCVTILPSIIRAKFGTYAVSNYVYYQVEFFILCAASIFYLFSPKYYMWQILSILLGIWYYMIFVILH